MKGERRGDRRGRKAEEKIREEHWRAGNGFIKLGLLYDIYMTHEFRALPGPR